MKKQEQYSINHIVMIHRNKAIEEYLMVKPWETVSEYPRLYSCNARIISLPRYTLLLSYSTIIACYCKSTNTVYDLLRYDFKYTTTSNQHITKFIKFIGNTSTTKLTYKEV